MFTQTYKIPAKGMLFGEYGVLFHSPAVALTFYQEFFLIQLSLSKIFSDKIENNKTQIQIKSSFYEQGKLEFFLNSNPTQEQQFFHSLFLPWASYLEGYCVSLSVLHSFSPRLGFGSSSALIAGVSLGLFEYFFLEKKDALQNQLFWDLIRKSIENIQGSGSGYDVGVQLASLLSKERGVSCFRFQNQLNSSVPIISKIFLPSIHLKSYGCFLKTSVYSETKNILLKNKNSKDKKYFSQLHSNLAENFLQNTCPENLKLLMKESKNIAYDQGLIPENLHFSNLVLKLNGLFFKTMGAGHGDCLWVFASKEELLARGFCEEDIAFEFVHCEE